MTRLLVRSGKLSNRVLNFQNQRQFASHKPQPTMPSKPLSPIRKAWYKWKALHLPWRKRFLVGMSIALLPPFLTNLLCPSVQTTPPSLLQSYTSLTTPNRTGPPRQHLLGIPRHIQLPSTPHAPHRTIPALDTPLRSQHLAAMASMAAAYPTRCAFSHRAKSGFSAARES